MLTRWRSWDYAAIGIDGVEANYRSIMAGNYSTGGTIVLSHEIDGETMVLSEEFLPQIRSKFIGGVGFNSVCQPSGTFR